MRTRFAFRFWPLIAAITLASCAMDSSEDPRSEYLPAAVVEYRQAPGTYAASSTYRIAGNTDKLLDFPAGGGTYAPDNGSLVSLGMAGGYVVLEFDPPLENYADAADFIVYGNAYYKSGDSAKVWHEPGTVWVMADENGNGEPDDVWLLLAPGYKDAVGDAWTALSDAATSLSTVTYTTDGTAVSCGGDTFSSSWWPTDAAAETSLAFENVLLLPDSLYAYADASPLLRGLADSAPTLKLGDLSGTGGLNLSGGDDNTIDGADDYPGIDPAFFYTVADTPGDRDVDSGSGGGAPMDIAWAVDPTNGFVPVDMSGASVRWVKIVSATTLQNGAVGDYSCEVDSVVRALAP